MTAYVERASVPPHLVDERDPPAIALLKEDHQILRAMFDLVETAEDDVLVPIAADICVRLVIHMAVEEHSLFPALRPVIGNREIDEGMVEHEVSKRLISEIMEMADRKEVLRARVHVLGETTVHHIDEEDRVIFRDSRKAWEEGKIDLVELGNEMSRLRRELFDLVGSVAGDTHNVDLEPMGKAIEELPRSIGADVMGANVPIEGQA